MSKWISTVVVLSAVLSARAGPTGGPARPPERRYKSPEANARVRADYLLASLRAGIRWYEVDRLIAASGLRVFQQSARYYFFGDPRPGLIINFDKDRRLDYWCRSDR